MYEFVEDLTSDVMFVAEGKNLEEVMVESAKALFDVVCQRKEVKRGKKVKIRVEGEDPKELVHEWLSELLTESDSEELFFSEFRVRVSEKGGKLVAECEAGGEPYSREKSGTVVKGVTYYKFSVEKTQSGYRTRVVVDI